MGGIIPSVCGEMIQLNLKKKYLFLNSFKVSLMKLAKLFVARLWYL